MVVTLRARSPILEPPSVLWGLDYSLFFKKLHFSKFFALVTWYFNIVSSEGYPPDNLVVIWGSLNHWGCCYRPSNLKTEWPLVAI